MSGVYMAGKQAISNGTLIWGSNTLKIMLLKSTYIFNNADASVATGLTAGEVVGAGYVGGYGGAGRINILNKTIFRDDANSRIQWRGDPTTWASLNVGSVAACAVIWETGGTDATAVPLVYIDGGFPLVSAGGPLTLTPASTGLIQLR